VNPSRSEKLYWSRLVSTVGCIACRIEHGIVNTHCSIHHNDGRTKPGAHMNVLPLCGPHHQTGGEGVAIHPFKRQWERKFGTQVELKATCDQILEEQGW
jgi:hypothetical protein